MPEPVDNIYLAAALLGASGTARVVGRCTGTTPPQEAAAFDYGAFLGQSRFCAAAADSLAKAAGVPRGPAQAAGLLHKLGRLVLALVDPEACAATRRDTLAEQLQAERAALGLTHPEAGLLLTRAWRLPASLCEAIRLHAEPLRAAEVNKLATVTALAAHMASVHTTGRGSLSLEAMAPLLEVLQLTGGQVTAIYASTRASFLK
jgi:HD-like signal output (HDOD) protein